MTKWDINENQSAGPSGGCVIPGDLSVNEVFVHYHDDQFVGYVIRFEGGSNGKANSTGSGVFESLFVPVEHQVIGETESCPKLRSASVEVMPLLY